MNHHPDSKKVWADREHTRLETISLLTLSQCEEMKLHCDLDRSHSFALICYSHWHRFLKSITVEVGPCFPEYMEWKKEFPGWSHGFLGPKHSAWKNTYKDFPMNAYYKQI